MKIISYLIICSTSFLVLNFIKAPELDFEEPTETKILNNMADINNEEGHIMLMVRIKTNIGHEELVRRAHEREPQFAALPGLIQKYYIKINENEFGGVYIWESEEALAAYRKSELAATIAQAYGATEPPTIERLDILFDLR